MEATSGGRGVTARAATWVADPAATFLLVATVVGLVLCFGVPRFAGIDEPGHFARTYQLSTGTLVPSAARDATATRDGGSVCLPDDVLLDVVRPTRTYQADAQGVPLVPRSDEQLLAERAPCPGGHLFAVASFAWYSPLAYAPQAVGVGLARAVGGGVPAMLLMGRLLQLAAYVAVVWLAIRRTPIGAWAIAAVALLPVALFQAATSLSPDAMTTAIALLVVSSALRMAVADRTTLAARDVLEAGGLCLALALCKPSYIPVALCYLLPLARRRPRWSRAPLAVVVAVAAAVSASWQSAHEDLFTCDTRFFGVGLDPDGQRDRLVHEPLRFVGASGRAILDWGGEWARGAVSIGDRVTGWSTFACAAVLVGFALVALQRAPAEEAALARPQRALVLGAAAATYLLVIAGWVVYCEAPPLHVGIPPHARLLVPLLALVPIALAPARHRIGALRARGIPITALVAPFELVWAASVVVHMR